MTHNWDAGISTNNAVSWSRRNPRSFTSVDGGFCCDQYAMYVPHSATRMVVWLLQYRYSATTKKGSQKIVVYNSESKLRTGSGAYSYTWNPRMFGFPAATWLDFPHLAYSNTYLYATSNVFNAAGTYQGTVCWRMSLSDMKARRAVRFSWTRRTSGGRTWRLSYGATTTMYWWQHETSSRGRLYSWTDAGSLKSRTINIAAWTWGTRGNMRCPGPDGRDFMRRADSRPLACAVGRGLISVMWHANVRSGRPRVYCRLLQIRQSNFSVATQRDIWNSSICWAYPSMAVNARGHLGGTIAVGGTGTHARTQAWIIDDLDPTGFDNAGLFGSSGGPRRNAWGDYLTCTFHPTQTNTWIGTGMYMNNRAGNDTNQIPIYVHFGRDRDVDTRPDLTPTSLKASSTILRPNFLVTITSVIANQGGRTASPRCSHRLSTNSAITTFDTLLYSFTLRNLAPATSRTTTRVSRIPILNLPSTCYLGVIADDNRLISERNESNNTRSLRVSCRPRQADLIPTSLTASTTNLNPLRLFNIRSIIRNQGGLASGSAFSRYYLSTNSTITTSDTVLGTFRTLALGVNGQHSHNMNVRTPSTARPGTCYLGVIADYANRVTEAFETNNARALRASCLTPFPDLRPTFLGLTSTTVRRGSTYTARSTIFNDGNATSPSTLSAYYLSRDSVITTADTLLRSFTTVAIAPLRSTTTTASVRIPTSAALGTCYLGVFADYRNTVRESQESDNTRSLRLRCIDGTPDLVIAGVSTTAPVTISGGSFISITSTTRNVGTGVAGSSTTEHVLSTDTTITTGDVFMGTYSTGTLGIGGSRTITLRSRVPRSIVTARCFVGAIADSLRTVGELNERNNTRAGPARQCRRFSGVGHWLEFRPQLGTAATSMDAASFTLVRGPRSADMRVVSPGRPGHWYLCLWSRNPHPGFVLDALTNLSLGLVNSPTMPAWFGRTDASGTNTLPALNLPRLPGILPFTVYTHTVWWNPTLTTFLGFGSNSLRNNIRS